jgi:hypothetical protein
MSKRKQPKASPSSSSSVEEDAATTPSIRGITSSVEQMGGAKNNCFRVSYIVSFTGPCCSNHATTRLIIKSNSDFFEEGADTAILMMDKTITAIKGHKKAKRYSGLDLCDLDLSVGIGGVYMKRDESSTSIWRILWASAENTIIKKRLLHYERSDTKTTSNKEKAAALLEKSWEEGCDFKNNQAKSQAVKSVEHALIAATKLSTIKATIVMSYLVSKLTRSEYFDENSILTEDRRKNNLAMMKMFHHASTCIENLKGEGKSGSQSKQAIQLLTGVAGLFIPPTSPDVSVRRACELLGFNRNSKYVETGMENRVAIEKYFSLRDSRIAVGDMVQCRGGYGTLVRDDADGDALVISLHPWKCDVTYQPAYSARMVRYEPNLLQWERMKRKDTVPQQWIDTITEFHIKHNHQSPNAKDQICRKHPDFPRQKTYAPVIYRYETWDHLWSEFKREHPSIAGHIENHNQPNECPTILRTHAAWNMVKGTDSSCLCINCEGTNAVKRGSKAAIEMLKSVLTADVADNLNDADEEADARVTAKLQKICNILEQVSKYDMCVSCLPCLTSGKLEDAKFKCVDGSCERCGFDKLWKHGVRRHILKQEYDERKREWVEKLEKSSRLATDVWLDTLEWRDYEYKVKPTLATHAREVARQAAAARPPEPDDLDYDPTENASARNLVFETKRGTVVDFLDHFERKILMHVNHRNLVSSEHRSKLMHDRNSRPLTLARDIDFAENGAIENFDKVQSEHWVTKQYTLFVSISSFLMVDEWNKENGELPDGAEVTVNGERYVGEERDKVTINMSSFWARVINVVDKDNGIYRVEDDGGNTHDMPRASLRYRRRHTICCGHISDDKLHDRFAMQQFTRQEMEYLERYMSESFPNDLINGRIKRLHQHSDNASQHFKSTGSIEFFTSLIAQRGGPGECMYVYSFGTPGHGKGVFDGVGGAIKHKVHSLIKGTKTTHEPIPGVDSGYISDAKDVFEAVSHHFENSNNHVRKKSGSRNNISHYKFFLNLIGERTAIERPPNKEIFNPLKGISSNYQFIVNNVGIVYMRKRSCWCLQCMSKLMQSSLPWGETYSVHRCISSEHETTTIYEFEKQSCSKTQGLGVAASRANIRQQRNEITKNLTPGDWVMFESPEPNVQPFWIGRAVSKAEWNNGCWYRNDTNRRQLLIGDVPLDPGEYAINVQWYTQRDIGSLEYIIDRDNAHPIVNHNTTLAYGGFEMIQSAGNLARVPRQRNVRQRNDEFGYAHPQLNLQTREGDWFRSEFANVYILSEDDRDVGLARCGVWGGGV